MTDAFERFSRNGISRRYILALNGDNKQGMPSIEVYDQRTGEFVPDKQVGEVDPDEMMRL